MRAKRVLKGEGEGVRRVTVRSLYLSVTLLATSESAQMSVFPNTNYKNG